MYNAPCGACTFLLHGIFDFIKSPPMLCPDDHVVRTIAPTKTSIFLLELLTSFWQTTTSSESELDAQLN